MSSNSSSTSSIFFNSNNNTTLNDGSGQSGTNSFRSNPSFLLFAIQSILIGIFLIGLGKRGWRITTGISLFLSFEFLTWLVIVNTLRDEGFNGSYSSNTNGLIIWAVVTIFGLLASVIGVFFWRVGVVFMGGLGGASLAFSIVLMAENDISLAPRWIIIGVLTLIGFAVAPLTRNGMAFATALSGSFLLFFGIDLLVNQVGGMSLGMRYLFDNKASHQAFLLSYSPPITTRVLLALIWIFAALSIAFQCYWYSAPFNRNLQDVDYSDEVTEMTGHDTIASKIQRRYELAAEEKNIVHNSPHGSMNKPLVTNHPQEMSSPDEPASRPSSIVSTRLANGLRSRPPTFFNEPFSEPTPLPQFNDSPSTTTTTSTNFKSFAVPIAVTSGVERIESSHFKRHSEDDDIYSLHPSTSNHSQILEGEDRELGGRGGTKRDSEGSIVSQKSYRKPVPLADHQQQQQQQNAEFEAGLSSGRNFTLTPSIAPSNYSDTTAGPIMARFSHSDSVSNGNARETRGGQYITSSSTAHSEMGHIDHFEEGERSPNAQSFRTAASNNFDH